MKTLTVQNQTPDLLAVSVLLERSEALTYMALEAESTLPLERWHTLFQDLANKHLNALSALDAIMEREWADRALIQLRQQLLVLENSSHLTNLMRECLTVQQCVALVANQLDSIEDALKMIADLERRASA